MSESSATFFLKSTFQALQNLQAVGLALHKICQHPNKQEAGTRVCG